MLTFNSVSAKDIALSIQDAIKFIEELDCHPIIKASVENITQRDLRNIRYARHNDQLSDEVQTIRKAFAPLQDLFFTHAKNAENEKTQDLLQRLCAWKAFDMQSDLTVDSPLRVAVDHHLALINGDAPKEKQLSLFDRMKEIEFRNIKSSLTDTIVEKTKQSATRYRHSVVA